jgi:hypothetical protein
LEGTPLKLPGRGAAPAPAILRSGELQEALEDLL